MGFTPPPTNIIAKVMYEAYAEKMATSTGEPQPAFGDLSRDRIGALEAAAEAVVTIIQNPPSSPRLAG